MKSKILVLMLSFFSAAAFATSPISECPKGIEGQWKCHTDGLGDPNTTFELTYKSTIVNELVQSYEIIAKGFPEPYKAILDSQWRVMENQKPDANRIFIWQNGCQAGALISNWAIVDSTGAQIGGTATQYTKMLDANRFSRHTPGTASTDICERIN